MCIHRISRDSPTCRDAVVLHMTPLLTGTPHEERRCRRTHERPMRTASQRIIVFRYVCQVPCHHGAWLWGVLLRGHVPRPRSLLAGPPPS
eukprot:4523075-Alexandrium_andersonii.AAC.1